MKYIIFLPILIAYVLVLTIICGIQCMWSFDFKNVGLRRRNLNHKLGVGYKLCDALGIN
jgi:hypothetical protein